MTKKQIKILICVIQTLLIAMLFLPVARESGSSTAALSTLDLARRYSDLGKTYDSIVYIMLCGCCPVMSVLSLFIVHERRNYGVGACLSALTVLVHACFYTSIGSTMGGSVALTGMQYFIVFLAFVAMASEIYGYLLTDPKSGEPDKDKKES